MKEKEKEKEKEEIDEVELEMPDTGSSNADVVSGSMQQLSFVQAQLPPLFDIFYSEVFPRLSNCSLLSFSAACKETFALTAAEREKREKRDASALLLAVVQGNETEAKRLLTINPGLLRSSKGEATDHFNRLIKCFTPFQAALCMGDVEMCEMMKEYFLQLGDGHLEMEEQFNAIFPGGLNAYVQTQQEAVFDFNEILQAIIQAPENEVASALLKEFDINLPLHQALEKFRDAFTKKSLSEPVFNPYHLLRAFRTYQDAKSNSLDTSAKCNLFWRQVVGFAERSSPACTLQDFVLGIGHALYKDRTKTRSFKFEDEDSIILPTQELSGLGFDFAVGAFYGHFFLFGFRSSRPADYWRGESETGCRLFLELCQSKISSLEKLLIPMEQCEQEPDMSDLKNKQARI